MYRAIITPDGNEFYAMIVRVDDKGETHCLRGYDARMFKTRKGAEKSTNKYIEMLQSETI